MLLEGGGGGKGQAPGAAEPMEVDAGAEARPARGLGKGKGPVAGGASGQRFAHPLPINVMVPARWRDGDQYQAKVLSSREDKESKCGWEYYVHYEGLNKRLDEWTSGDNLNPDEAKMAKVEPDEVPKKSNKKRKVDEMDEDKKEKEGGGNNNKSRGLGNAAPDEHTIAVKNIDKIEFGKYEVETWYFSPYPHEFAKQKKLFICEFCLNYMKSPTAYTRHKLKCDMRHPPGDEIYRKDNLSFFEVDGKKNKIYCQNLCLVAKLFLDHKTLYYDVEPFMFYIMTECDDMGCHIVGYFSKEKDSPDDYNVACILTLPQHQRKGYGRLLIDFSYHLSKKEEKVGSPEKPLSDLGLLSYRSYWTQALIEVFLENPRGNQLSIKDISTKTCIKVEDITSTLHAMGMLKYTRGRHVIAVPQKLLDDYHRSKQKQKVTIDSKCLHWAPLRTAEDSKRYGTRQ